MKRMLVNVIKHRLALVIAGALLAALLLSGLSSVITRSDLFSLPGSHAAGLNPIQVENQKPGTPGWDDFSADLSPTTLSGFGSQISVNHGQSIDFYVTTTAPTFTIDIYRTGYYGGAGARLVTSLGTFTGLQQAIPAPDPVTGMISCANWTKTTTLTIPSDWVTGVYLAKLTSSTGYSSFIFFVVRDDGGDEDILFQTSVTTYEAYNTWGGTSLYNNDLTDKTQYPYPHATKVSFDRPFNPGDSNGAGQYFWFEYKFVYWLEQQGYNVAYTTDVDTDARPGELLTRKAFLSVGHDEYWSMGMRNAVVDAINAGVNVAFFSANAMYWQIRFEPNAAGVPDRVEVGYKDFATFDTPPGPDPMWNVNNSVVTTNWRDPVVNMPENAIEGVMYEQQQDNANYNYVVENASNWIYAGTGFTDGTTIPGIVGYEYDKVWNNGATPANVTVLSNSPVHGCCGGFSSFSNSTLYTASSGARVFAAGTMEWSLGLANIQGNTYQNTGIQQTTANILNNFIGSSSAPNSGVSISSDSLSFGYQAVNTTSAAQTVKITNSGTAALSISNIAVTGANASDFAQTNTCPSSLAVNASCTINVTFTPTASGSRSGNITLTDSSTLSPQDIILSGTAISSGAAVHLSATYLSFGNQTNGTTSKAQTVQVTNTGAATLTFSAIQLQGVNPGDFAQTNTCPSSLAVGASCTINVTFTPIATSTRAAYVALIDNVPDSPESIELSGTGVTTNPAVTLSPLNINFDNQNEGATSAAQTVTLTNTGTTSLTINSIAVTGANAGDFAQSNTCPGSLATNADCTINVTFTPQDTGLRTGSIVITDSDSSSPQTVSLSGTGVQPTPEVNLNPNSLSFGGQNTGTTSAAQTVTLTNTGTAALTISSIGIGGTNASDFAQTNTCPVDPASLAVNASCTISVTFTPSANGSRTANITVTDNADGEGEATQAVALTGTGGTAAPAVGLNPTSLTFASQTTGTTSSAQAVMLTNTGTAALSISSIAISGTNASDFAQSNTCPSSLAANANCTISVTFTPGASGTRSASVTITDNASDSPESVALSGTGTSSSGAYFSDGFESGDLSQWNPGVSGTGSASVQSSVVNSGKYGAQLTNSSGQTVQLATNLTGVGTLSYTRFYVNFGSVSGVSLIALAQDSSGHNQWILYYDNGRLDAYFWNSSGQRSDLYSNGNAFQANTWYSIEVEANQTSSGHGEIWINGTSIGSFDGNLVEAQSYSKFIVDNEVSGTLYFDDVAVANTYDISSGSSPVSLSPGSLTFASQNTGTTSAAQAVTLTNNGTTALTISSITITGTNASDFAQSNTCPSSLAANANCTISVTFTPGASGTRSASVTITDNASDSPESVALSGTGTSSSGAYFSDGFESGDLSQWNPGVSGTGSASVQSSVVNSGKYGAQLTNSSGQTVQLATNLTGVGTLSYTRFYVNFGSVSGVSLIALAQDSSGHNQWILYYDNGRLDAYFWNSSGQRSDLYSNGNAFQANTWYSIEVEANQTSSGHGEIWINGTSIGSFDGNLVEAQSYSKFIVDNEVSGTLYFDDVAVANTYNGPISLNSSAPSLASHVVNPGGEPVAMIERKRFFSSLLMEE